MSQTNLSKDDLLLLLMAALWGPSWSRFHVWLTQPNASGCRCSELCPIAGAYDSCQKRLQGLFKFALSTQGPQLPCCCPSFADTSCQLARHPMIRGLSSLVHRGYVSQQGTLPLSSLGQDCKPTCTWTKLQISKTLTWADKPGFGLPRTSCILQHDAGAS